MRHITLILTLQIVLLLILSKSISKILGQTYVSDYYYELRGNASESFGYSLTPVTSKSTVKLIVGAPRTRNALPIDDSHGGFYVCSLESKSCGANLISQLNAETWRISSLGLSVSSTYGNGLDQPDESVLVCDPRARVIKDTIANEVIGVGVCYAFSPDQYTKNGGVISFLPRPQKKTSVGPMLFGYSVVPLPNASAYAFGIPYFLMGFGGVFYSSEFSAAKLNSSDQPLVTWGHSHLGGLPTDFANIASSQPGSFERFYNSLSSQSLEELRRSLIAKEVPSSGCSGFAVAASKRLLGDAASGSFDLVEGSPCVPDLSGLQRSILFDKEFIDNYITVSKAWTGIGNGVVKLYREAEVPGASPRCGRKFAGYDPNELT